MRRTRCHGFHSNHLDLKHRARWAGGTETTANRATHCWGTWQRFYPPLRSVYSRMPRVVPCVRRLRAALRVCFYVAVQFLLFQCNCVEGDSRRRGSVVVHSMSSTHKGAMAIPRIIVADSSVHQQCLHSSHAHSRLCRRP